MSSFTRLVRFAQGNSAYYGELIESKDDEYRVQKLQGSPFSELRETGEIVTIQTLLCPLESTPIIICIGLNYRKHVEESGLEMPKHPAVFTKPRDALAGPFDDVKVHPSAQSMLDWEAELAFIVGRDAKNISEEDALDYVIGYTVANDVSARNFQAPEVSGGQFCYAKSFDGFAPIGHALVSPSAVPSPLEGRITTKVNGITKQDANIDDLIFGVRRIVSHLSRGTTLRAGTVIMTGTPAGVGLARQEFLGHGDVVEVEIEGIGKIRNVIRFEG